MPRIKLLTDRAELPAEQHAEYDRIAEILGRVGGPFGVLMYSPGLAVKVCEAGAQVRLGSSLTSVERELTIIATSREKDAAYEWAAHVRAGRNAGMKEETIDVVRSRGDSSSLDQGERDIVEFVRQLLRTNRIDQGFFDELIQRHGIRWVVEIAATCGQYQYIAAINNTFGLEPAADGDPLPIGK